jgi:hypothetical protein
MPSLYNIMASLVPLCCQLTYPPVMPKKLSRQASTFLLPVFQPAFIPLIFTVRPPRPPSIVRLTYKMLGEV